MSEFLDTRLQVLLLILLLYHLETLLLRLVPMGEGVSVHDTHATNAVYPSLS